MEAFRFKQAFDPSMSSYSPLKIEMLDSNYPRQLDCFPHRRRVLMLAYYCNPVGNMEERNGWMRAIQAAEKNDVTVFYSPTSDSDEMMTSIQDSLRKGALRVVPLEHRRLGKRLQDNDLSFHFAYRQWHHAAYQLAKKLHQEQPFDLTHLVTPCGYREPGYIWRLNVPHIWGPIGGTHNFPMRFWRALSWSGLGWEAARSVMNFCQLHYSTRVRAAARKSTVVAASQSAAQELRALTGKQLDVDLETGIDHTILPQRGSRDVNQPFKMLWAGRLREWKSLPLLLHALNNLPRDLRYQLRVVGDGDRQTAWKRLADKLGVASHIEWIERPTYSESLAYYRWADAFVFTSLRDTSGTGLVEALAAGAPIIGVNHQGAADVMTDECAIRVPVTNWQSAVTGFRDGIVKLAADAGLWQRLSHGATDRAHHFEWSQRSSIMQNIYNSQFTPPTLSYPVSQKFSAESVEVCP